jgi:uncharacterized protein YqgV (UPF0045/DUF77 family)
MHITAEISLYPLKEDYGPVINRFISELEKEPDITVDPGSMSTLVSGEYEPVMRILSERIRAVFEQEHVVFTLKISNSCGVDE